VQSDIHRLEGGSRIHGRHRAHPPLVSIITVLFRDRDECSRIIDNVLTFDRNDFELIVIDGGSDDGTVDLLRQRDTEIDYWLSEPDSGIYDAMNKGVAVARGWYILHINAGDRLQLLPAEILATCLREGVDVASFVVDMGDGDPFNPETGFSLRLINTWHHQGTFYRRTPLIVYDTSYRVFADFDLNQRLLKADRKVRLFPQLVALSEKGGLSHDEKNKIEIRRCIQKNFGRSHVLLHDLAMPVWPQYQALRRFLKRIIVRILKAFGKSWG
jgi:glycosyltransferase involved in cell wall biosynthesis